VRRSGSDDVRGALGGSGLLSFRHASFASGKPDLGADFSGVRVGAGGGRDPLLGHELSHGVQQAQGKGPALAAGDLFQGSF
jgi:hypothetical protein